MIIFLFFFIVSLTGSTQEKIPYQLTINIVGNGSVSPSPGTYYYSSGTTVYLSATPNADWAFDHWEGSISGTDLYTQVYMNGPKTVTAVFSPAQWRLTLTHSGNATGTTFPSPGVYGFLDGQTIGISVATAPDVFFGGWSGDVSGTDEFIQVYMNSNKNIDARFTNTGNILNIYVVGNGGTIPGPAGNPHRYSNDVSINITTYSTDPLWRFDHWIGDIDENDPQSSILFNLLMNRNRTITAVFIQKPYYKLTMEIIGEGKVTIQEGFNEPIVLNPGINEFTYLEWTYIRCERIETSTGWKFLRWEGNFGDTSPTYPRCSFSMDRERYIKCIFINQTHVPDVMGMPQSNANSAITNAWLTVGEVAETCSNQYPSGYVLAQDPPAGTTVEIGSSVSLTLSSGPCPVSVPNLVSMTTVEAETSLASVQLILGNITEQCNNEIPTGRVVSQTPNAGEQVYPGSKVDIVVSSGPCPVPVPNILWRTRSEAENMILADGLIVGIVEEQCDDTIPANRVINQFPQAGQQVAPGSAINFAISNGPCLVTVPNIVSYRQSTAENILTTAGLVVGEVSQQCHPSIRAGIVIRQTPYAGEQVSPGTAVDFVVSTGPCSEGTPEGTQEGEGILEGIQEGSFEGIPEGVNEGMQEGEGTGEGIIEGYIEGEFYTHSADQNGDWKIDLGELLRVIQFFNSGGYHCEGGTEDGYAPGAEGDKTCLPHASDYNEQDWVINLLELLRIIQFFNIGSYYPCLQGEDGYCPG